MTYSILKKAYGSCSESRENFGSAISIYGSIKANPRRFDQYNVCQCAETICGTKINKLFPTSLCADCRDLTHL